MAYIYITSSDALLKATFPSQVVWCAQWDPSSQPASQLTKMLQLEMKRHTFSFLLFASVARTKKQLIDVRLVLSVFFVPCNPTIRSCVHN